MVKGNFITGRQKPHALSTLHQAHARSHEQKINTVHSGNTLTSDVFGGNDVLHRGESLDDVLGQGPVQLHLAFLQLLPCFLLMGERMKRRSS